MRNAFIPVLFRVATPLYEAIYQGQNTLAIRLLSNPDTNIHDGYKEAGITDGIVWDYHITPLMCAAQHNPALLQPILSHYQHVPEYWLAKPGRHSDLSEVIKQAYQQRRWDLVLSCSHAITESEHYDFDGPARRALRDIIAEQFKTDRIITPSMRYRIKVLLENELHHYLLKNRQRIQMPRNQPGNWLGSLSKLRGYTAHEKSRAAAALLMVLRDDADPSILSAHNGALHNGKLAKLHQLWEQYRQHQAEPSQALLNRLL